MKILAYLAVISIALMSMAAAQDFVQGEAKGADAPGAAMIGDDLTAEVVAIWNGAPIQLSGVGADVFDTAFFKMDGWVFDVSSYSMTPSQSAFIKDNPADGKPLGQAKKAAFVGAQSNPADPRS